MDLNVKITIETNSTRCFDIETDEWGQQNNIDSTKSVRLIELQEEAIPKIQPNFKIISVEFIKSGIVL